MENPLALFSPSDLNWIQSFRVLDENAMGVSVDPHVSYVVREYGDAERCQEINTINLGLFQKLSSGGGLFLTPPPPGQPLYQRLPTSGHIWAKWKWWSLMWASGKFCSSEFSHPLSSSRADPDTYPWSRGIFPGWPSRSAALSPEWSSRYIPRRPGRVPASWDSV